MINKFEKERNEVLKAAKAGIRGNLKLSSMQKKYIKNLLLFALMKTSSNESITPRNFLKSVNSAFKDFLLKILSQEEDDEDIDWEDALNVELNNIIANEELLKNINIESILTPSNINAFLKNSTKNFSRDLIIKRILALRDAKRNYRETPEEEKEREKRSKEHIRLQQRSREYQNYRSRR
jgi:hypothetical protein